MITIQAEAPLCTDCGGEILETCLGYVEWQEDGEVRTGPMFACGECGKRFVLRQIVMSPVKLPETVIS